MSHSLCSVAGRDPKKQLMDVFDSQGLCHQQSYCRDMVNVMGTLPEMVTLGCLHQALPKWTVPAHGSQSWSQGW